MAEIIQHDIVIIGGGEAGRTFPFTTNVAISGATATVGADRDDDSGSVGASDLLMLLVAWGTDPGGPPNYAGDRNVAISDLLANWGPCP